MSITGSGLTSFALGVWVYGRTGSVTQYSLILLATTLPGILVSPFAGVLVDRLNRGRAMMLGDGLGALVALSLALLFFLHHLHVWALYILLCLGAISRSLQLPAYVAATTLLVPRDQFARAGGLMQTAQALSLILGPGAGAALVAMIGIRGVLLVDCTTFLFALTTLALVDVPSLRASTVVRPSLLRESMVGWSFIYERPGLLALVTCLGMVNFCSAVVQALITPMMLDFSSPAILGTVLAVGSLGMLAGGIIMSLWRRPLRKVQTVLRFSGALGIGLSVMGIRPSAVLIASALFICMFSIPPINASSQAIWQSKIPPALQGRVFAVRSMIALVWVPIGYMVAGPIADRLFRPLLAPGGPLTTPLSSLVGVGSGRGIGLFFVVLGGVPLLASLLGYLFTPLREVETELPDFVPPSLPAAAGGRRDGEIAFRSEWEAAELPLVEESTPLMTRLEERPYGHASRPLP